MVLQALTLTPLGITQYGNTGWIGIPGVFTLQPAEVMKCALCIWLPSAMIAARKRYEREGRQAVSGSRDRVFRMPGTGHAGARIWAPA